MIQSGRQLTVICVHEGSVYVDYGYGLVSRAAQLIASPVITVADVKPGEWFKVTDTRSAFEGDKLLRLDHRPSNNTCYALGFYQQLGDRLIGCVCETGGLTHQPPDYTVERVSP